MSEPTPNHCLSCGRSAADDPDELFCFWHDPTSPAPNVYIILGLIAIVGVIAGNWGIAGSGILGWAVFSVWMKYGK